MPSIPSNLPPDAARQELPADPLKTTVASLSGWWIEARCICGRSVSIPLRMIAAKHEDLEIGSFIERMKCEKCGSRPGSVSLVDNPAGGAKGRAVAPNARAVRLK